MKKLIIVIVSLLSILVFSASTANAVELVSKSTPITTTPSTECATFILSGKGRVCGILSPGEKVPTLGVSEGASEISRKGYAAQKGRLVREKAYHFGTLDQDHQVIAGGSSISVTMEITDAAELQARGIDSAAKLVDATIVAIPSNGGVLLTHRFASSAHKGHEVAKLYFSESKYVSVQAIDWDGNGTTKLALRVGTTSGGNGGGNGGNGGGNGENGGGNGENGGGNGENGGGNGGNGGGNGGNGGDMPNPHYRDF